MQKIIYLSIVLLVVSLFLISIGFSSPTLFNNNNNNNEENDNNKLLNQNQKNSNIDKEINNIINKGYKKMVDGLKLKSQYHYNEDKYMKRAMEKQQHNPLGYKCQHDSIAQKRIEKVKNSLKSLNNNNNNNNFIDNSKLKVNEKLVKDAKSLEASTTTTTTASQAIRFKFDTSYITGTKDPFACHNVGDVISVGESTGATEACQPDGSVEPCLYTCTEADIQTSQLQNFYKDNIIETIKEVFQSRLLVRNPQNSFTFNPAASNEGFCDYGVQIPDSYYTTGIQGADIYVWVTSRPTTSNNTIAYAFACDYDTTDNILGRPRAASINFNPMFFSPFIGAENSISFNEYVRVGIHEMTHALGFSSSFFNSFVTPNTRNVIRDGDGAAQTFKFSGKTPKGESYSVTKAGIYSENVVNFAKQHYGCDDITYQELEDFGGSGTAGSHWEARTAGEEYMLGFVSPVMPITDLSFNLLLDSGWYEIVTNSSEPLIWGKGLGCDFVQKPCSASTWNYQGYFCTENGATSCTGTRMGKGVCRIVTGQNDWQPMYQHLSNPKLVGYNLAADGCPFYSVQDNNVYCFDTSKQSSANSQVFEEYCENCRCFEYRDSSGDNSIQQSCWEQRCGSNGLQIKINNDWIDCPDSQTVVSNGVTVVCPTGYTACGGEPKPVVIVTGNPATIILPYFILVISLITLSYLLI
ncbi:hypothetical protein ACTA71_003808 [Dictyostelium dimigraforme]